MKKIIGIAGLIGALYFSGCSNDKKFLMQRCENENLRIDATVKPGIPFDEYRLEFYRISPSEEPVYIGETWLNSMNGYFDCKNNKRMTIRLGNVIMSTQGKEQ